MKDRIFNVIFSLLILGLVSNLSAEWTGTWSTSIYSDNQLNYSLDNSTLRQVVRVSISGDKVRLKFSNLYGGSSLEMQMVSLAISTGGHAIDTGSDIAVTFGGSQSVTIPAGGSVISDELNYELPALTNMAISINFGSVPSVVSGHVGSRTTSYWQSGEAVSSASLSSPSSDTHWFVISGIDVDRDASARSIVAYGDSITDGLGTTTDAQNRWTDRLADRLQADAETSDVGVLNGGIGGTTVAASGLNRLQPDVLGQTDVRYLIVLYGVNDILFANQSSSSIISAYQSIITSAHNKGIYVYGGTIMPFGGYSRYTEARETVRQEINTWIRTVRAAGGGFDAVIDFDVAMRDPQNAERLNSSYSLDWLHPNPAGYQIMADAIYLGLFASTQDTMPPLTPAGLSGISQGYKQINLEWGDNSELDFSHYILRRSPTEGGAYSIVASYLTESAYSDTGLSAITPYYYVVSAMDISGNESIISSELKVTTKDIPDDSDPPVQNPAVWDIVPYAVRSTEISMTAAVGIDDNGPVEYYFEETTGNPGGADSGWQLSNSYTNSGLSANTEYSYRVRMRDNLGNTGEFSSSESVTPPEGPGEYQESGGILSMEAENGAVGSRWLIVDGTNASNSVYIEIDSVYNNTGFSPECLSNECIASYNFNITTGGSYLFWFRILSNTANDDSFFWRIDDGSWNMENNRYGTGVWYSTAIASMSPGSHTLAVAYRENGTQLDKFVIQLDCLADPSGDGPAESTQSQGANDNPPSIPTGLAGSYSSSQVVLTWSVSGGATGYNVKRSETNGGPYSVIAPDIASNTYSDSSVVAGNTYYYVVSAENSFGESSNSSQIIVVTTEAIITDVLKIDFGSSTSPLQSDYELYSASHEQASTFSPQSYSAFGAVITVTPSWGAGAEEAVMQMINRGTGDFDDSTEALVQDWIGSDTRSEGDPMTLTISGLPSGSYNWLSYHTDTGTNAQVGMFDVTVNDGNGLVTVTDIRCTNSDVTTIDDVAKFKTTIVSNGVDDIRIIFDNQPYSNEYNEAWFVMNGFEIGVLFVSDPQLSVLRSPSNRQLNVPLQPSLQWFSPTDYTPVEYDVYFGTNPVVTANTVYSVSTEEFTPTVPLEFGTTYYWTIVAYNGTTPYASEYAWSFTTKEEQLNPVLLSPSNTQTDISVHPTLKWLAPADYAPDKYEVYLGTNPSIEENAVYIVMGEEFSPAEPLEYETTYYWAVKAYNGENSHLSESVWSFTTVEPFVVRDRVAGNMMLINDNAGWCWYQDDKIIYDPVGGNVLTSTTAQGLGFGGVGGERTNDTDVTTFNPRFLS